MAEATLGRLELRGLVPRGLGQRPAVALERALGEPFRDALADAFESLSQVDPGALWVLRGLDVRLAVPAGEPDATVQSRRVAAGLALAVQRVVAAGPSAEAVRFTSRAEFVAAYLRARLARHGESWVFQRFAAVASLPVADSLAAAARIADVNLLLVVTELATGGGWARLVATAGAAEVERLVVSLGREAAGMSAPAELLALVSRARAQRLAPQRAGTPSPAAGARARLELLGELATVHPVDAALVAAVWQLEPATGRTAGEAPSTMPGSGPASVVAATDTAVMGRRAATPGPAPPDGPSVLTAAGAAAFLLLPDLEELLAARPELAGPSPAAAAVRAAVLAGVFGNRLDHDDPAVSLAAGLTDRPESAEWADCLAGPVSALADRLAADPVLGWQHRADAAHVATTSARHPALGILTIALLRRFARHLPGFAHAGAAHLVPQVLPLGGTVRVDDDLIEAVLPAGPLHILLGLAGLDTFACRPPWLAVRVVVGHEVSP